MASRVRRALVDVVRRCDPNEINRTAGGKRMRPLLAVSSTIDLINEKIGYVCNLLVLLACLVSAGNAMIRYAFDYSSNGWLELQWYMFAVLVMFGASYTFKRNEHVRVEIFYLFLSERGQLWLDLIGTLFFLIPACLLLAYLSWPFFMQSYSVGEMSGNAGGLVRWPIKFVIPSGFVMLALQGVSEVIKRIAALRGEATIEAKYERPTQ
jgi:TRAP-type mannitol/chloroaromatic compound transport system permease small subunit